MAEEMTDAQVVLQERLNTGTAWTRNKSFDKNGYLVVKDLWDPEEDKYLSSYLIIIHREEEKRDKSGYDYDRGYEEHGYDNDRGHYNDYDSRHHRFLYNVL